MAAQRNRRAHPFRIKAVTLAVASCFTVGAEHAAANPTDPSVVSGSAVFNRQGNTLSVTNTPGAIINWRAFSVGSNEVTRFIQQSAASSVLNRVTGVDPSVILGALQSNGRVFLINPNGILFGAGAQVDVAGLVASTLNLSNTDFAAGRLRFTDTPGAGAIANQGSITTPTGGQIYLIAPNVQNSGVITSPKGEVILAAGRTVEIVDSATPNLRIEITAPDTQAVNLGAIVANSGKIGIYAGLIKNSGEIRADSVVVGQNGEILLRATKSVTLDKGSVVSASGPSAGKVTIQADNGTVAVAGTVAANAAEGAGGTVAIAGAQGVNVEPTARISADGLQGGAVSISSSAGSVTIAAPVSANALAGRAGRIAINAATTAVMKAGAQLSANGVQGGTVAITGGSGVTLESGSVVQASGVSGGTVILQADDGAIDAQGTIDVTGTDDNGGLVGITANGDITLDLTSRILARGRAGGEVRVEATRGTLLASGLIDAQGGNGPGGKVWLLAPRVALIRRAVIDVSGETGGGEVLIGGDYQGKNPLIQNASRAYFGPDALIRADAVASGTGGKVIIWSNDGTQAYGTISARGGAQAGNGGFVETSGKAWLDFAASVDTSAPHGVFGKLLLDPKDIDVNSVGGGAYAGNHLFTDNLGGASIIDPANINSINTSVVLQADNDITFSSPINNLNPGVTLTVQAGKSIFVNADIKMTDADITLHANEFGAMTARTSGAAMISMAPGTTINAGTGNIYLRVQDGSGHTGGAGFSDTGNIVIGNLIGANVSVIHDGLTADSAILRASNTSLITTTSSVFMELENAFGANASIGTQAAPIRIDTPVLEAHYHNASGGIYFDSPNPRDLQIGGVPGLIFSGMVRGVQTISGGPIEITVNGKLTQFAGTGSICGTGGLTGGPICAGGGTANPGDSLTLRASDMDLQRPVNGWDVFLLPNSGGTVTLGSAGSGGSLHLSQSEMDQVAAFFVHVGDNASGNVGFAGDLTIPQLLDIRTGGSIAAGANTLTVGATGDGNLDLHAQTGIQLNVKTATLSALNAGASGNIDITETGASGTLTLDSSDFPEAIRNNAPLGDIFLTTSNRSLAIVNSVIGQRDVTLTSTTGDITIGAPATPVLVDAGRDMTINAVNGRLSIQGGDTLLGFGAVRDASVKVHAANNLTVNADGLTVAGGNAVANGISSLATSAKADAELSAGGNMTLTIGTLGASVTAGTASVAAEFGDVYDASANAKVMAGGDLTMNVAGGGVMIAAGVASAQAQSGSATVATANANTLISAGAGKDLSITVSAGDLVVRAGGGFATAAHVGSDGSTLAGNNTATGSANVTLSAGRHLTLTVSSGNLVVGGGNAGASANQRVGCCSGSNILSGTNTATGDANVKLETTGAGGNLTINLAAGSILQVGGNYANALAFHSASSTRTNTFSGNNTATANAGITFNAAGTLAINGTPTSIVRIGMDASPSFVAQRPFAIAQAYQTTYGGSGNNLGGSNQANATTDLTFTAAGAGGINITAGDLQVRGGATVARAYHKTYYGNSNTLAGDNTASANSEVGFKATHASGDLMIDVGSGSLTVTGPQAAFSGGAFAEKRSHSGYNHDLTAGNNMANVVTAVKLTAGRDLGITAGNLSINSFGGASASANKRVTGSNASAHRLGGTNTANGAANTTFSAGNNLSVNVGTGSVSIYGAQAHANAVHTVDGGEGFVFNMLSGNNSATANAATAFTAGGALTITADNLYLRGGSAYASAEKRVYGSSFAATHDNIIAGVNTATANSGDSVTLSGNSVTLNLGTGGLNVWANSANASARHTTSGSSSRLNTLGGDNFATAASNISLKATGGVLTVNSTGGIWITGADARASAYKYVYGSNLGSPNHFVDGNNTATANSNITLSGVGVTLSLGSNSLSISGGRATADAYHHVSGSGNTVAGNHVANATANAKIDAGAGALLVTSSNISIADGGESGGGAFAHAYLNVSGAHNDLSIAGLANDVVATRNITLKGGSISLDATTGSVAISGAQAYAVAYHAASGSAHTVSGNQSAVSTSKVDFSATGGGVTVNAGSGVFIQGSRASASAYKYVNGSNHSLDGNNNASADSGIFMAATGGPLTLTAGTLVVNSGIDNSVTLNAYKLINSGAFNMVSGNDSAGGGADIKITSTGNATLAVAGNFIINNSASHYSSVNAYQKINNASHNSFANNQAVNGHADIAFDAGGALTVNVTGGGSIIVNSGRDNFTSAYAYRRLSTGDSNTVVSGANQATGRASIAFGSTGDTAINVTAGSLTLTTAGGFPYNYTSAYAYNEIFSANNTVNGTNTATADALITFTSRSGNVTIAPASGMTINGNYGNYTSAYAYNEVFSGANMLNVTNTATGTAAVRFDAAADLTLNVGGGLTARSSYGAAYAYNQISGDHRSITAANTSTANSNLSFNAGGNLNINVSGGLTLSKGYSSVYAYNDISGNGNVVNATNTSTGNPSISFTAGNNLNIAVASGNFAIGNSYASIYASNFVSGNLNTVTAANTATGNSNISFTGNNINVAVSSGNFTVTNSYASAYAYNRVNGNGNALAATNTALGNENITFTANSIGIAVSGALNLYGSYASAAAFNKVTAGSGNSFTGANTTSGYSNIVMNAANTLSVSANGIAVQAGSAYGTASNNLVAGNTVNGTNALLADGNIRLSAGLTSLAIDAGTGTLSLSASSADVHAFNIGTPGGGNTATAHANVLVATGGDLTINGAGLVVQAGSVDATTGALGVNAANGNANAGILALGTNTVTVSGSVDLVGGSISASGVGAAASAFAMLDPAALTVAANDMNLTTNSGGIILAAPGTISITTPGGFFVNGTPIAGGFAGFTSDPGVNFGLPSPITSSVVSTDPLVISFGGTNRNLTTLFGLPMAFLPPPPGAVFWDDQAGDHLWMNPVNWSTDALPMFTQSVTIGSFAPITLNGAAPNIKSLFSDTDILLTAGGSLTIANPSTITTSLVVSGGTLTANGGLTVNALNLSAGALNGTGNLVVGSSFSHTGGSIGTSFDLISITQGAGNLAINNPLSATAVYLTAPNGNITEGGAGAINTNDLAIASGGTVTLNGPNSSLNIVADLTLNGGTGALSFTNAAPFNVAGAPINGILGIKTNGGDITLTSTGAGHGIFVQPTFGAYAVDTGASGSGILTINSSEWLVVNDFGDLRGGQVALSSGNNLGIALGQMNIVSTGGAVNSVDLISNTGPIKSSADITAAGGVHMFTGAAGANGDINLDNGRGGSTITAAGLVNIQAGGVIHAYDENASSYAGTYANLTGSAVTLNAGGFVYMGGVAGQGNLTATTGNVSITAGGAVGGVGSSGSISAPLGSVIVNAGGFAEFDGPVTADGTSGSINVNAAGIYGGANMNAKTITLNSSNDIYLYNAAAITGGTVNMQAVNNVYLEGITINATDVGLPVSTPAITLASTAANIYAPASMSTASGAISINAAGFVEMDTASNGSIVHAAGDASITAGTSISALGVAPASAWMEVWGKNVTLNAGSFVSLGSVSGHGLLATNGNVNVTAGTSMGGTGPGSMKGPIVAVNGDVHISLLNAGGPGTSFFDYGDTISAASAGHTITIDNGVGGAINSSINSAGTMVANSDITLKAAGFINIGAGGLTSAAGNVNVNAGAAIVSAGAISAGANAIVNAGTSLFSAGPISAGGNISLLSANGMSALVNSAGSNLSATNSASGNLVLTSSAPLFTVGPGGASVTNNAPGGAYSITGLTDLKVTGPTGNSQTEIFGANGNLIVDGYTNMSGLPVVFAGNNVAFSGGTTDVAGLLSVFVGNGAAGNNGVGNGPLNVYTTVQAGTVNIVAGDLIVDAGNFRSLNASFSGAVTNNVNLSNGGIIYGNPDINKLTVGGKINIDDPGSRLEAASANSIYISFPQLQSGGFFVNGTPDLVWDPATGTGFFAGGLPAILGVNLKIDYGVSNGLLQSVIQAINTSVAAIDQSVQFDDRKDKDPLKEAKNDEERSLGNNLKLMCN